jgi:hypothetical protein
MKKNETTTLFPDPMRCKSFWNRVHEQSHEDGSPFAVWQQIRLCNSTGDNLPKWAMDELNKMAKKILCLEKVKSNNYGEFLAETFNLNGSRNKSARGNREIIKAAFKAAKKFDKKTRTFLIDDLINSDGLSENKAKKALKYAKYISALNTIVSEAINSTLPEKCDLDQEELQRLLEPLIPSDPSGTYADELEKTLKAIHQRKVQQIQKKFDALIANLPK